MDETNSAGVPNTAGSLPTRFTERFGASVLDEHGATLVAVDTAGVILWFNRAWQRFAYDNDGAEVLDRFGVGANYFDGIAGELREVFRDMFVDSLRAERVVEMEYECSSVDLQRHMRLRTLPIAGAGLLLEHSCIRQSPQSRQASAAFEALYVSDAGFIVQCSNCRRVRQHKSGCWDWVSDWVARPYPATSHGVCEVCHGFFYGTGSSHRLRRRG